MGSFLDERKGGYERWQKYRKKLDEEGVETQLNKLDKEAEQTTSTKKRQYRPPEDA